MYGPDQGTPGTTLERRKSKKFMQDLRQKKQTLDVQIVKEQTLDEKLKKGAETAIDLTGKIHCHYIQYIPFKK